MREHLYRGFHECDNGTIEITVNGRKIKGFWVEGYFWVAKQHNDDKNWTYIKDFNGSDFKVVAETVGEFTGLCDKANKQIVEGDILLREWEDDSNTICVVIWYDGGFSRCSVLDYHLLQKKDYWFICGKITDLVKFTIIGNIHENPELLEEK